MNESKAPARGRCAFCDRPMPKNLFTADGLRFSRSRSLAVMDREGHFDTLRCAASYGITQAKVDWRNEL